LVFESGFFSKSSNPFPSSLILPPLRVHCFFAEARFYYFSGFSQVPLAFFFSYPFFYPVFLSSDNFFVSALGALPKRLIRLSDPCPLLFMPFLRWSPFPSVVPGLGVLILSQQPRFA